MKFSLTSPNLQEGDRIPVKYTCDGEDISPPLSWQNVPDQTQSFVLIFDDPDASKGTWVHWVIYNIPADKDSLPKALPQDEKLKDGSLQGINDFGNIGYEGPCPHTGVHRYSFKLYALDSDLNLEPGATKSDVENAMEGAILSEAKLMAKYSRE